VLDLISRYRLMDVVDAPGFVDGGVVEHALDRALCLALPSSREGYGLVVLEALSRGTPAVVVRGEDNAASEFIEDGENGFVAPTASAEDLADAIVRVHEAGGAIRDTTLAWFTRNAERLSLTHSLDVVLRSYADGARS
jgi:glycosyltransferase involved in cell wall biosynthesis